MKKYRGGFPVHTATGGTVTTGGDGNNVFLDQAGVTVSGGGSLIRSTNNATAHIEGAPRLQRRACPESRAPISFPRP